MTVGLRDVIRAIREYPALSADLKTARSELRQSQQALERSEQECKSLNLKIGEQLHYVDFLSHQSVALQAALREFCPQLTSVEDRKRFYDAIAPSMDPQGFTLYRMAKDLTGIDVSSFFPYEDNRGLFEEADGRQLLRYLTAAHFHAVDWTVVPNTTYERAALREVDTSSPEYRAFEQELYGKALERMGFQDILAPNQEVSAIEEKKTELKLYSPLSGELFDPEYDEPDLLDGSVLAAFQDKILRKIEDEQMPEEEERGLMAYFDGSDAVNEKVVSLFPSVEVVDGELYGVAVCQISGTLTPGELEELKDYCHSHYNDAWGEGFAQRPRRTEYGDLYVSFYTDNRISILTKEEMETARAPSRAHSQPKRGGDAR